MDIFHTYILVKKTIPTPGLEPMTLRSTFVTFKSSKSATSTIGVEPT